MPEKAYTCTFGALEKKINFAFQLLDDLIGGSETLLELPYPVIRGVNTLFIGRDVADIVRVVAFAFDLKIRVMFHRSVLICEGGHAVNIRKITIVHDGACIVCAYNVVHASKCSIVDLGCQFASPFSHTTYAISCPSSFTPTANMSLTSYSVVSSMSARDLCSQSLLATLRLSLNVYEKQ